MRVTSSFVVGYQNPMESILKYYSISKLKFYLEAIRRNDQNRKEVCECDTVTLFVVRIVLVVA